MDMFDRLIHRTYFEGEGGGGGTGSGGGSGSEEKETETNKETEDKEKKEPEKKSDDFPWDEFNRMKRTVAETAQEKREREAEEARKRGEHERLEKEAQERATNAERERDELKQQVMVTNVAGRDEYKMKDPTDAKRFLGKEDMTDEASVERALTRLKERRPELFVKAGRTGGQIEEEEADKQKRREREVETGKNEGEGEKPFGLNRLRSVKRKDT